jgi:hypothetical protein
LWDSKCVYHINILHNSRRSSGSHCLDLKTKMTLTDASPIMASHRPTIIHFFQVNKGTGISQQLELGGDHTSFKCQIMNGSELYLLLPFVPVQACYG